MKKALIMGVAMLIAGSGVAPDLAQAQQPAPVAKGGHFAAWEQPELFASELRAAFRSLR